MESTENIKTIEEMYEEADMARRKAEEERARFYTFYENIAYRLKIADETRKELSQSESELENLKRIDKSSFILQLAVTLIIATLEYAITKENYIGWGVLAVLGVRVSINHWVDSFRIKKAKLFVAVSLETVLFILAFLICCLNIFYA